MELVGVAVVSEHQGAGVGGGRGVLMPLVVPRSLALRERRPLCGVRLAVLMQGQGNVVRRGRGRRGGCCWWCAPGPWKWGGAMRLGPRSRFGCRALLAGMLVGPLARRRLLGLAGVRGGWSAPSPCGRRGAVVPAMRLSEEYFKAPDVGALVCGDHLCGAGFAGGG